MEWSLLLRAVVALACVLLLIGGVAYGLRFWAQRAGSRVAMSKTDKRLRIQEVLALDVRHRFVLVTKDDQEYFLLLGQSEPVILDGPCPKPLSTEPQEGEV